MPFLKWKDHTACFKEMQKQYDDNVAHAVCQRLEQKVKEKAKEERQQRQ